MDKREIENQFGSFVANLDSSEEEVRDCKERLDGIRREIDSIKDQISELFAEKRAAEREEKPYYQERIEDLLYEKDALYELKAQVLEKLKDSKERLKDARQAGNRLSSSLNREIQAQQQNAQKLNSLSSNPFSSSLQNAKSAIESGFKFSREILNSIASRLSRSETSIDIHFEPIQNYYDKEGEDGLSFAEPSQSDVYLTGDGERAVPMDGHTVFDTLDTFEESVFDMLERGVFAAADGAQRVGDVAVEFSCALLKTAGHTAIMTLGGPGQPDILSLDQEGKLWVTESKGTAKETDLIQSGLERPVRSKSETGFGKLMENSPAWLIKKMDSTLSAINSAIDAAPSSDEQSQYKRMRDAYVRAARRNFRHTEFKSQVMQVGFSPSQSPLKPPYAQNSQVFDRWVEKTQPDKIVQIDIVPSDSVAESTGAEDDDGTTS